MLILVMLVKAVISLLTRKVAETLKTDTLFLSFVPSAGNVGIHSNILLLHPKARAMNFQVCHTNFKEDLPAECNR